MQRANIGGISVAYDIVGTRAEGGRNWVITPGGRFPMTDPGIRPFAETLAAEGHQVLIWDRPNTGESDVSFAGDNESAMQADTLAGLLRHVGMTPAVVIGGSGGSRISLLTVSRHPDVAAGVAAWWISGGVFGLMTVGTHYCAASIRTAWEHGMEAVCELPEWAGMIERRPSNRDVILALSVPEFVRIMERWMLTYCPSEAAVVPGLPNADMQRITVPALVFRSGMSDIHHRRETTEQVAALLPQSQLVEPPWPDTEWMSRHAPENAGAGLFARWPLLAPQLLEWAASF